MTCKACKRDFNEARNNLYKDALTAISDSKSFEKLPTVLMEKIVEMAYPKTVTIIWERKTRCCCRGRRRCRSCRRVSRMHWDDNDYYENDGYLYYTCKADLCVQCFLEGIERVMINSDTLPFLRIHSNAFFNKIPVCIDPYKYIVPYYYQITYYRRKKPVKTAEGNHAITTN